MLDRKYVELIPYVQEVKDIKREEILGGFKMSKEQIVAQEILKNIGGKENIKSMEHCATRLRLIVKDKSLINEKAIENIDGVRGQFLLLLNIK